jgi:DNA-binding response OmpR family regulator
MAKGELLIAEDDAVLRNLYLKKFEATGFSIRAVEDGELALQAVQERTPDLLILDLHMPKVDGFQVLEKFPKGQRTFPVIILTNFDDPKYRTRGAELGVDDYFVKKDMTIKSLVEMVENLMRAKKYFQK